MQEAVVTFTTKITGQVFPEIHPFRTTLTNVFLADALSVRYEGNILLHKPAQQPAEGGGPFYVCHMIRRFASFDGMPEMKPRTTLGLGSEQKIVVYFASSVLFSASSQRNTTHVRNSMPLKTNNTTRNFVARNKRTRTSSCTFG
ncbi:AGAP009062-PA, partial [Anopheles gambiae str. PEST]